MFPKNHKKSCSCGVCQAIRGERRGFKTSENVKIKLSKIAKERGYGKWLRGRKHSPETLKKKSDAQKGEKGSNWKGGITPLFRAIRTCFKYRQWRSDVFMRDDFICQECSIRGGKINADHIKPFNFIVIENNIKTLKEAITCEELWNINNGRTLCDNCHRKTDTYAGKGRKRAKVPTTIIGEGGNSFLFNIDTRTP